MSKALSITIHPEPLKGDYLTVSDAMKQVLDFVEALERLEDSQGGPRQIVWRLTSAHTNSPPFTVVAEPFPVHPSLSVAMEANRLVSAFVDDVQSILTGTAPTDLEPDIGRPLLRVFERNLNGIGRTEIRIDDEAPVNITPQNAKLGVLALEGFYLIEEASIPDLRRTEHGTVEGEVTGLTRWNSKPAIKLAERLSGTEVTCVLTDSLAQKLGLAHQWIEAWEGRRLILVGLLHFNAAGVLKRVDAHDGDELKWNDVSVSDLREIDILQGRTVSEHLRILRGDG